MNITNVKLCFPKNDGNPSEVFDCLLEKILVLVHTKKLLVNVRRGYPTCDICGYSFAKDVLEGSVSRSTVVLADVVVPDGDTMYVFPTLLYHYIKDHGCRISKEAENAILRIDVADLPNDDIDQPILR